VALVPGAYRAVGHYNTADLFRLFPYSTPAVFPTFGALLSTTPVPLPAIRLVSLNRPFQRPAPLAAFCPPFNQKDPSVSPNVCVEPPCFSPWLSKVTFSNQGFRGPELLLSPFARLVPPFLLPRPFAPNRPLCVPSLPNSKVFPSCDKKAGVVQSPKLIVLPAYVRICTRHSAHQ